MSADKLANALPEEQTRKILAVAVQAGEIMLRNGAEISRVEETVTFLGRAFGVEKTDCLVIPTGLYVSLDDRQMAYPMTLVRRVPTRTLNYNAICAVNDLSRRVVRGLVTLDEAQRELDQIAHVLKVYPYWLWLLAGVGTVAGSTLLLGGTALDVAPAAISAVLVQLVVSLLEKSRIPAIFGEFFGAALATAIALGLAALGLPIHINLVVAGGILRLVPGGALVASVQDGISGNLLSSAARALEAFLKGAAVAGGVGLSLSLALQFGLKTGPFEQPGGEVWQIPIQFGAAFLACASYGATLQTPRFAILTTGLAGAVGWLAYLLTNRSNEATLLSTFLAALMVGLLSWGMARLQHSPVTIYILPGILPLLPGLPIYRGMLSLAQNQTVEGLLLLVQAVFLGGALAAGVALSNSFAPTIWRRPHLRKD